MAGMNEIKKALSKESTLRNIVAVLAAVCIAVVSFCVLANVVPQWRFFDDTVQNLEVSKRTVMEFSGATLVSSVAITMLPDDIATPLAESLSDMNNYFLLILVMIFVERLIVLEGVKVTFLVLIPVACGLYLAGRLAKLPHIKKWAYKLVILGLAMILVIPCSTHLVNTIGADYLAYVDETIEEANAGANKINTVMEESSGQEGIFERLSNAFQTAISGVNDLLEYFKNTIKKCFNAIAILIVTNFVMPILVLLFFKWLLNQLFQLDFSNIRLPVKKESEEAKEVQP